MLDYSIILPQYPRTRHLPYNPNAKRDDLVVTDNEADVIFTSDRGSVEEKVDGANCGMTIVEGHPLIRNHNHVLKKGFHKRRLLRCSFRLYGIGGTQTKTSSTNLQVSDHILCMANGVSHNTVCSTIRYHHGSLLTHFGTNKV